jgi:hypothetical protein
MLQRNSTSSQEIVMKVRKIFGAVIASVTLAPMAAFAGGGDELSKEWLASLKSTKSVQEVRAELEQPPLIIGQRYPVDQVGAVKSERLRAEVKAEMLKYGTPVVGA